MPHNKQKKIAVINDFCGFGRCSIAVSLPIISALKVQCCPLPTSIFSNHTGFESFYYSDFTRHMESYAREWEKLNLSFSGILTGFLGSPRQIDIVAGFFERFAKEDTITVIDPVMGDNGSLYATYSPVLAKRMSQLVPYAHILTPNLTEACILSGTPYKPDMGSDKLLKICQKLSKMGPKEIVISGLDRGDELENFVFEDGKAPVTVRQKRVGPCRSGTGDVFSSIIAADAVNGIPLVDSVHHASEFISKVLRRVVELDLPCTDGLCIEEFLKEI